jgi:hypothetical protein
VLEIADNSSKKVLRQKKLINDFARKLGYTDKEFRIFATDLFMDPITIETVKKISMKIMKDFFKVHNTIIAKKLESSSLMIKIQKNQLF